MFYIFIGYVTIHVDHAAIGEHVPMSSPPFYGEGEYCLSFNYKVWVSALGLVNAPPPRLELYIRTSRHVYSGWKLWTSNETGEGHAHISFLATARTTYRISFVAVVGHVDTTLIRVANIRLDQGSCSCSDCIQETFGSRQLLNHTFSPASECD